MGHRHRPARTRPPEAPQGNGHLWQPAALQLRLALARRHLPPKSLRLPRRRLQHRPRADGRHLLWRAQGGRKRRRPGLGHGAVLAPRDRAHRALDGPPGLADGPAAPRLESRQGERAGDVAAVAQGRVGGDGARISEREAGPSADRFGGHVDGQESAGAERHRGDEQSVWRHYLRRGEHDSGELGLAAEREFDGRAGWEEQGQWDLRADSW